MASSPQRIDSFRFGKIVVDGTVYTKDLILTPEGVRENWWRKEGHGLHPEDLDGVLDPLPDILIVGCGALGVLKVPEATREWIREQGIQIREARTGAACDLYNEIAGTARVVAGLHLTC
jgi:hypothetical protein